MHSELQENIDNEHDQCICAHCWPGKPSGKKHKKTNRVSMKRTRIAVLNNHDNGEGDGEVIQMLRRRQALRRRQRELMVSRAYVKDDDERGHARL
jgi:hypothetical protein